MTAPVRLALFGLAAAAAFGIGFGVGDAAGPFEDAPAEQHAPQHDSSDAPADPHGWHDGTEEQP